MLPIRADAGVGSLRCECDDGLHTDLLAHIMDVSQRIGAAVDRAFSPAKVGLMIAGLEVPHVHVHIVPIDTVRDLDFANADANASPESLDDAAGRIRAALEDLGPSKPPV